VIAVTHSAEDLAAEVARLESGLRDLMGLLAMPAAWTGRDATEIAGTSLDILVASLRLDVACLRLKGRRGAPSDTIVRVPGVRGLPPFARSLAAVVEDWLAASSDGEQGRVPWPAGHGFLLLARVPLGVNDDLGVLVAGSRRNGFPTELERLMLHVASNQAATGLQEAQRWRRSVRERALRARFEAMLDERTRLAREIHDTLLQGFTGLSLQLAALAATVREPETAAALSDMVVRAQGTLTDARRAVWGLRAPVATDDDLGATLQQAAEEALAGAGVTFTCDLSGTVRPLSPDTLAAAARVAQEALANVVRHAHARRVQIRLAYGAQELRLTIEDDGAGFVVDPEFRAYGGHWGLIGMHERAAQARGRLLVQSAPGAGTVVTLRLPFRRPSPKG